MTDSPGDLRDLRLKQTRDELHTGPMYQLHFDGKKLGLVENGAEIASWSAVSGKPGSQEQQHEILRDRGPLPSGRYKINVDQIQKITDWEDALGRLSVPNWRGGRPSWGNYRAWLTPLPGTNTHGRGGFAIHGGSEPGSRGCIDLTDEMEEFVPVMAALGQRRIDVTVDYGSDGAPNHRRKATR